MANTLAFYDEATITAVKSFVVQAPGVTILSRTTFSVTTFSITTFSIMTFSIMTFSITTFSITTLSMKAYLHLSA